MDTIIATTMGYLGAWALSKNHRKAVASAIVCGSISRVVTRSIIGLKAEDYPLEAWIKLYKEEALDPDEEIIDPHHHLWDVRVHDKGWPMSKTALKTLFSLKPHLVQNMLSKGLPSDTKNTFGKRFPFIMPYMADQILRDIGNDGGTGHNVTRTVYLECGWNDPTAKNEAFRAIAEGEMAQKVANQTNGRICSGIVGYVDLRLGAEACEPALEAFKARVPNFRGVRHSLAWTKNKTIMNNHSCDERTAYDPKFRSAFALLNKFGLSYDCWLYHGNINALKDLALAFPETTIICDHVGQPLNLIHGRDAIWEQWASSIADLALECPNVYMKLSGLGMRACGFGFDDRRKPPTSQEVAEEWKPYILHCIKHFGVKRCMFASNFPVDKISCSYTVLWNAFKRIVKDAGFTGEDRRALFYSTAKRVYKLE